jgi:hypothetical protein
VLPVGDVAGDRHETREPTDRVDECVRVAGVHDDAPAALGERTNERKAEAARRSGDDSHGHAATV